MKNLSSSLTNSWGNCKIEDLKLNVDNIENRINVYEDYDEIKKLVDEAMSAGTERDVGHDYLVSLEERLSKSARDSGLRSYLLKSYLIRGKIISFLIGSTIKSTIKILLD